MRVTKALVNWYLGYPKLRWRLARESSLWNVSRFAMFGGTVFVVGATTFCLAVAYGQWSVGYVTAFLSAGFLGSWHYIWRPWIGVDGDDIVIVGQLLNARIPLRTVVNVGSGQHGVWVMTADGRYIAAWAVQQGGVSKTSTRSAKVVAEIERLVMEAGGDLQRSHPMADP